MNIKTLEDVAFTLKYCKENNKPMPIVFLGAGASVSSGIPLTGKIIDRVYNDFGAKPSIRRLKDVNNRDYYEVMKALRAEERQDLFKSYIEDPNVKLNLASIYLAQLLKEKYVDYVFTVNFDDLLLKSCALFNFIPPVYDISNLEKLNTNKFVEKSVVYLHGQYFGQWLLNTPEEIQSGKENVNHLFQRICDRPWIIVGYSGEDEVFDELNKIQSFASDLYWVSYSDNHISDKVKSDLLDLPSKNAYLVSNIDADTFFLKLSTELGIPFPHIFDKPFSFLESMFENLKEVSVSEESKYKELYQNLSKQREISLKWIKDAKETIENANSIEKLQQEIIDANLKKEFSDEIATKFEKEIKQFNFHKANKELSDYYNDWGIVLSDLAKLNSDEKLSKQSIEKYKKAIELDQNNSTAYNNYGVELIGFLELNSDEKVYEEIFEIYKKAIELDPKTALYYNNYGIALSNLAKFKSDKDLYMKSMEQYEKAIKINPKYHSAYNNYGILLENLAKLNSDKILYELSFEKYKNATDLNPMFDVAFDNWSAGLINYYYITEGDEKTKILNEGIKKAQIAYNLNPKYSYNLACCYALLKDKENSLLYLEKTLDNKFIDIDHINKDNDWDGYRHDNDFIALLNKYTEKQ